MSVKLKLPEACSEKWETMTSTEKGRYYKVCNKEIFDFREKSNKELYDFISNSKSPVCGRLLRDQIIYKPLKNNSLLTKIPHLRKAAEYWLELK